MLAKVSGAPVAFAFVAFALVAFALVALAVFALAGCARERPSTLADAALEADRTPEAYARSTAALMWPGATRAFQVTPAGDLFTGDWVVRIQPSDATADAPAGPARAIAFEQRWRPIARWVRRGGGLRWSFEAVAWPAERDTNLFVSMLVRVDNESAAPRRALLAMDFAAPDTSVAFVAFDARDARAPGYEYPQWAERTRERPAAGFGPGNGGAGSTLVWTLPAHGSHDVRIVLSAYVRPAGALEAFARVPHARRVAQARAWWDREAERGTRIALGDPEVEAALAAARVTLLACRERRGSAWVPIGGPFQYRDVWLRDGARAIQALALLGYTTEARQLAAGLATLQWPWGAFLTQRGQPDGTGQALWAFDQAWSRPAAPADSIAPFADRAVAAWRWCEATRAAVAAADPAHRPLMPYAEPRDNELVRAPLAGTDAWTIAGYAAAARLAAAAGRHALADSIDQSRRAYARAFLDAVRASGSPDVPAAWRGTARDWGNVAALYPCRAGADAGDSTEWARRSGALARRLLADGGGLTTYGVRDSLHGYLGADVGGWALAAGDRATFEAVLGALLHWRTASGGWAELWSRSSRDFGRNLPPHASSAAAFVALVRNALIDDDGDELALTRGAKTAWWTYASVHGAPTRWGTIDLAFHRRGDVAEWTWTPVRVATRLRLPPGTEAVAAPPPLAIVARDEILAPPGAQHATVTLRDVAMAGDAQ